MKQEIFSHYDFIVIGDHPAGLWGAKILLEKGLKVLVIPMATERARAYAPRFALDGLEIDDRDTVNREADPIQILTPNARFRVFPTPEALREEIGFVCDGKPNSELARGMTFLLRGCEVEQTEDFNVLSQRLNEMVYFQKPGTWLKQKFLAMISRMGGHVLPEYQLKRIFIEKRSFVGLQVDHSSSMITAERVLISSNWDLIHGLMSEQGDTRSRPSGWSFELKLKVSEEVVPVGLTTQMLWVQDQAPTIEIEHLKRGEFSMITTMPFQDSSLDRTQQRKVAQRLLRVMSQIIPDLEYNLNWVSPDIRDPERTEQVDLVKLYPYYSLGDIPQSKWRYASSGVGLGTHSEISKISFAYEEAFPRLGEWGAYLAVQQAIQDFAKLANKIELQKMNAPLLNSL
jgi:hypothetical protein